MNNELDNVLIGEIAAEAGSAITEDGIRDIIKEYLEENPVDTVTDYPELTNKPKINDIELTDNKTAEDLGLQPAGDYALKEEIPEVPSWAMGAEKPEYTYTEVGADPAGSADNAVSNHNVSDTSHNDLRLFIQAVADRLNALANSDDETLDETKEIVAYIKDNRDLISQITINKVSVADIVNDLVTNVANKPLSAAQGVAIKALLNDKLDESRLAEAINEALTQAEASGEFDGADGKDGEKGADGISIVSVEQTVTSQEDEGINTFKVTLSNGQSSNFSVRNGSKGSQGIQGIQGEKGETGPQGPKGDTGETGAAGYTPVKGTDYFTSEDKTELVNSVLAALPTWTGGSY